MVIQRMWTAGEPEAWDLRVPRQSDCESIKLRKNIIIQLLIGTHMFWYSSQLFRKLFKSYVLIFITSSFPRPPLCLTCLPAACSTESLHLKIINLNLFTKILGVTSSLRNFADFFCFFFYSTQNLFSTTLLNSQIFPHHAWLENVNNLSYHSWIININFITSRTSSISLTVLTSHYQS